MLPSAVAPVLMAVNVEPALEKALQCSSPDGRAGVSLHYFCKESIDEAT
jgi:hypothetical protein